MYLYSWSHLIKAIPMYIMFIKAILQFHLPDNLLAVTKYLLHSLANFDFVGTLLFPSIDLPWPQLHRSRWLWCNALARPEPAPACPQRPRSIHATQLLRPPSPRSPMRRRIWSGGAPTASPTVMWLPYSGRWCRAWSARGPGLRCSSIILSCWCRDHCRLWRRIRWDRWMCSCLSYSARNSAAWPSLRQCGGVRIRGTKSSTFIPRGP